MTNAVLNNAIKNINALYDVVGELQGRLKKLEDKEDRDLIELPALAVDTQILVRDHEGEDWERRYFKCWDNKSCVCFVNGAASWSTSYATYWKYWKLPESNNE